MPPRREIPSLTNMCVESIAENVMHHSRLFKNSTHNKELRFRYGCLHRFFGELLLEKLCPVHQHSCKNTAAETRCFTNQLFTKSHEFQKEKNVAELCLDFIFHRDIKKVLLNCQCYIKSKIPTFISSHIFTKCVESKSIDLHRSYLDENRFLKTITGWSNLVTLNLSQSSCTDRMVIEIWNALPHLRELILSFCSNVTNESLRYLCSNRPSDKEPAWCKQIGCCSNLGKKLQLLDLDYTSTSLFGTACVLLHLHSLEYFNHSCVGLFQSYVAAAVLELMSISIAKGTPFIPLKLKYINCEDIMDLPEDLRRVLSANPRLEKLVICATTENLEVLAANTALSVTSLFLIFPDSESVDSLMFQNFLRKHGEKLKTLAISVGSLKLAVQNISKILRNCKNLNELQIRGWLEIYANNDIIDDIATPFENLTALDSSGVRQLQFTHRLLFLEILKHMINLKILEMSSFVAENLLEDVLETGRFDNLERIIFNGTDMRKVSLRRLSERNNLKEIILKNCGNTEEFCETLTRTARSRNFQLNIKSQETIRHSFHLPHELVKINECCQPSFDNRH